MFGAHSHQSRPHRSIIVESSRTPKSSRCRAVWVFAADRVTSGLHSSRHGHHGKRCPRWVSLASSSVEQVVTSAAPGALRPQKPPAPATDSTFTFSDADLADPDPAPSPSGGAPPAPVIAPRPVRGDAAAGPPPPLSSDPDAILDSFVAAFGLPRQQLRMVLERQPALQRASPSLLAGRIAAFTRSTGLSAYQLLYMIARRPTVLKLAPTVLRALIDDLARGLNLSQEDGKRLVLRQPALLELRPSTVRQLSRRVCEELRVKPRLGLKIVAGLPPEQLAGLLGGPPGLLRERAKGLRRMLKRTFGPRRATPAATWLLASRCPPLLVQPTKAVAASLAALMAIPPTKGSLGPARSAGAGGGAPGSAAGPGAGAGGRSMLDAIMACPHLLSLPPETLRSRFVALVAAARIDTAAVVSMLLLQPRLLLVDPARVRARVEGLTFSLMVPRRAALDMLVRQPQLLLYQTETLADNWAGLQGLLAVTFETVLSMVMRYPNLLCCSASSLASKLAALEAAFCLPRPRAVMLAVQWPKLLSISERRYQRKFRLLSSIIGGLDAAALGRLVLREPYLLVTEGALLMTKVRQASSLLGVADTSVGDMLGRSPHFITEDPSRWQANLQLLEGGMGLSREQACAAAVRYPGLLARDTDELSRSVSTSMSLLSSSRAWMKRLERADPDLVFKVASAYNNRALEHLRFLVDSKLQSQQPFAGAIIWDRASFLQRYPDFVGWQRQRAASATAPNGVPWPPRAWGGAPEPEAGRPAALGAADAATLGGASPSVADTQPSGGSVSAVGAVAGVGAAERPADGQGSEASGPLGGAPDAGTAQGAGSGVVGGSDNSRSVSTHTEGCSEAKTRKRTASRRQRVVVLPSVSSTDE